jgi:hypothetical protein
MDSSNNGGVSTEQILAILGAKEVEVQVLRQQVAALQKRLADEQPSP